ncbi:MAG TPA: NAD(P)-dependent alcohol dehydrogenase [Glaciibacter sp.]|nr:NAD(P)-dependent alcohol dehydrogenase [Glaciibacter sp.]
MSNPRSTAVPGSTEHHALTMLAIVQHSYGTADVLHLEEVEKPVIGADDVLVRVRAASVNHGDWIYTSGRPLIARLAFGLSKPRKIVRGKDITGVVEAVGANVNRFRVGDEVYTEVEAGGFAEYARVPQELLAAKPENLTFEQAAAVPLAARTALQGLRDAAKVQPGQKVLINGASGGVGTFAVQIARALGAEVTGVCSSRNADMVRSLGADHVIDYSSEDFTAGEERYDVIFDLVGNHSLRDLRYVLTRTGTLVLSSGTGGSILGPLGRIVRAMLISPFVSQKVAPFTASRNTDDLDALRDLIESGRVTPAIDRTYRLGEVPAAIRYFAEEHARGKIVVTM